MISPIENNGMLLRTQDFSAIRHNEDNQSNVAHLQIQGRLDKTEDAVSHTVVSKEDANQSDTQHDARKEGKNKYYDMRKKKKTSEVASDGVVIKKTQGGFNITI